jgi:hypothetical protein
MKALFCSLLLAMAGTGFCSANAAKHLEKTAQAWEKLGSRVVTMSSDHDEIPVTVHDGFYTAVQLRIMKAPIHLTNINIVFGNGDNENVVFDKNFAAGSETRVIDLPGNNRVIKKVMLNYHSVPTQKGRAVVSLWGRH